MPIRYYSGVEGSCKTSMMTKDLYLHKLAGGRVLSFPGYELYGDSKKQVLSEPFLPEQILTLLSDENLKRQRVAIAMDEVGNFFNHHNWYLKICDILQAVLAERRKLGIAVLMTGPIFGTLPPDIRNLIHEIVHCTDNHTLNHAIPRGQKCIYYKEDLRGLLSNPRHRFSRRKVFLVKPWYKHFDTYAAVDIIHQFIRMKFSGRQIVYGPDGKVLNDGYELDPSKLDGVIRKYQVPIEDPRVNQVKQVIDYLKGKGIQFANTQMLCESLHVPHLMGRDGIGSILKSLGAIYKPNKGIYDLSAID